MSDLAGKPKVRFSRFAALLWSGLCAKNLTINYVVANDNRRLEVNSLLL